MAPKTAAIKETTATKRSKGLEGRVEYDAARAKRRLKSLQHLKGALGRDVVKNLGISTDQGLEVVRRRIEKGVASSAVGELQKELSDLGVSRPSQYVEAIASRSTRARRQTLSQEQAEKLVRVAGVLARAIDVWESEEDAAEFLVSPHPVLGGESPIERARGELGARQVEHLLIKLDLGLPA